MKKVRIKVILVMMALIFSFGAWQYEAITGTIKHPEICDFLFGETANNPAIDRYPTFREKAKQGIKRKIQEDSYVKYYTVKTTCFVVGK